VGFLAKIRHSHELSYTCSNVAGLRLISDIYSVHGQAWATLGMSGMQEDL